MQKNSIFTMLGGLATLVAGIVTATADARTDLAHLHPGLDSRPPIGWVQFCADNPSECRVPRAIANKVSLSEESWRELIAVNLKFNKAIAPVTDQEQYGVPERWTYATTGRGDCEDYVLEKRRELGKRGWPLSALLITVVLDKDGGGHAVLTVMTDRGDFVLDNQTDTIHRWSESGLTFIKRQSAENPNNWLDLGRLLGRPDVVTATAR
jgi:predicted transglutaminase-like cysteine proteinase